jgi:hypothetical protein
MELPLTRKDCAVAVTHHNKRRQLNAAVLGSNIASLKHDQSFAAFQSNCASNYDTDLYFTAEGIGTSVVQLTFMFAVQLTFMFAVGKCVSYVLCQLTFLFQPEFLLQLSFLVYLNCMLLLV